MGQVMLQQPEIQTILPKTGLLDYFRSGGDRLAEEYAVLQLAINNIFATEGHITHKAIILWLVKALETTDDVVMSDIIRQTLEIVVSHTLDDI